MATPGFKMDPVNKKVTWVEDGADVAKQSMQEVLDQLAKEVVDNPLPLGACVRDPLEGHTGCACFNKFQMYSAVIGDVDDGKPYSLWFPHKCPWYWKVLCKLTSGKKRQWANCRLHDEWVKMREEEEEEDEDDG